MVWLDEIVEGSKLIISAGQSHGRHSIEGFCDGPSTSLDVHQDREDEDFDHAIALSLAEEEQNKGKAVDNKANLEDDEQLAKALQESLNSESSPPSQNGRINQPFPNFIPPVRRCAGCNREIGRGRRYLGAAGSFWHPECFCCHECNRPITDYEFSMHENNPYHKACHKKLYHPKCDVCKDFIPQIRDGRIEYQTHPFWEQKFCPIHERDGTPRCCSCERMEPRDAKYVTLDDGRKLCLECLNFSIMDTTECQPLYLEIQEFYEGLNMKVEQPIPLLLVERQALNEAMEGEKNGTHHLPETRGLCLSEEQIIRTVLKRPIMGPGNRLIDLKTGPHRLVRLCEVTAILILYGLPRLLTGSILAHEMMHGWLRLKGYRSLDPEVEEGICQVLGHMWLDSEIISGASTSIASSSSSSPTRSPKKGAQTVTERKLGDFFKHQIESDPSPAYGDGFRAANRAVDQHGLRRTLDHMRLTGTFPH